MRVARAALYLTTAMVCAAADRVPTELFPPKTRMVMGISLRPLLNSPLLQAAGGSGAILPSGPFGGIDPKDVDEIVIASEGDTSDAPSIVVVRGRLRLDPAKAARHGDVPIFQDRKGALALLDATTAIAGSPADVKAAIDRRGGASTLSADLAARIDALSGDNDFWAVGDVPEGAKSKNPSAKGMDSIERFDFGASLRSGLQLRGSVRLRSDQDAAQLAAMIGMFGAMLKSQPGQPSGAKFDLRADGRTIHLDIAIPEAELKRAVGAQRNLLTGMLQGGMPAALGSMSPPPAASRPAPRAVPPTQSPAASPGSPAPARVVWSFTPSDPATVITNDRGETVTVTLPGAK